MKTTVRLFCSSIALSFLANICGPAYALEDTSDSNTHSIQDIPAPVSETGYEKADTSGEREMYLLHQKVLPYLESK